MRFRVGPKIRFKIGSKIMGGFSIILILLLVIGVFSYWQLTSVSKTLTDIVEKEMEGLNKANEIRYNIAQASVNVLDFMLTGQESSFSAYYEEFSIKNPKFQKELIEAATNEEAKKLAQVVIDFNNKYSGLVEQELMPVVRSQGAQAGMPIMEKEIIPVADQTFEAIQALMDYTTKNLKDRAQAAQQAAKTAIIRMIVLSIIAVLAGFVIAVIITRMITKPVRQLAEGAQAIADGDLTRRIDVSVKDEIGDLAKTFNKMGNDLRHMVKQIIDSAQELASTSEELSASAEETTTASEQVAKTISELAAGVSEQAKSVEEASTIINQMAAGTQQVTANAESVGKSSLNALGAAENGVTQAQEAIDKIQQVQNSTARTAAVINKLGEDSKQIGNIVDVIKGIADQTNLLALNAAIEAARAGEQGRGFAVVADEVRKLAEQSSTSAGEIARLISNVQKQTEQAVQAMDEGRNAVRAGVAAVDTAGGAFEVIEGEIGQVVEQIQQVSAATQQMAVGSTKAVQAISNIAAISEESAASAEEISASAEEQSASMEQVARSAQELTKLAEALQKLVARFKV